MQGFATGKVVAQLIERVSGGNEQAVGRQLVSLGLSPARRPDLSTATNTATADNTRLIKNIPDEMADRIAGKVRAGWDAGKRHETLAKELEAEFGIGERRARLIARDQVNKINGSFTEARHRAAGITHYRWQSGKDSRVRPAHLALNGKVFSWDDPPSEGHPGQPIQCRCTAAPVTSEREIAKEMRHPFRAPDLEQALGRRRVEGAKQAEEAKRLTGKDFMATLIDGSGVSQSFVDEVTAELALINPALLEKLWMAKVRMTLVDGNVLKEEFFRTRLGPRLVPPNGVFVMPEKRIGIGRIERDAAGSTVLHEVGHAVNWQVGGWLKPHSETAEWAELMRKESTDLMDEVPDIFVHLVHYPTADHPSEYLAETFALYHHDPVTLRKNAPETFLFWKQRVNR